MNKLTVKDLCITAIFMALVVVLSSFGIPVPGGHLYLNDMVIVIGSLLMGPFEAFMIGGVGAFLGDLFFYPTPMFVSLVVHGLQAVVISLMSKKLKMKDSTAGLIACIVGAIIMVAGYTIGRAFIYATPSAAMLKLPFQILQAIVGVVVGWLVVYKMKIFSKIF
jgi:uncharacterized membrane protein